MSLKRGIAFFGPAGAGKTTLAENLATFYGGARLAFADELRKEYSNLYNVSIKTLTTVPSKYLHRDGLQRLGDERRAEDPMYWVSRLQDEINRQMGFGRRVFLVDDVRYQNEYDMLRDMGFKMVLVEGVNNVLTPEQASHSSEQNWRTFAADIVVPWHAPTLINDLGSTKRAIYERLAYLYYQLDGDIVEWNRRVRT